jgi:hypothetical protein
VVVPIVVSSAVSVVFEPLLSFALLVTAVLDVVSEVELVLEEELVELDWICPIKLALVLFG